MYYVISKRSGKIVGTSRSEETAKAIASVITNECVICKLVGGR